MESLFLIRVGAATPVPELLDWLTQQGYTPVHIGTDTIEIRTGEEVEPVLAESELRERLATWQAAHPASGVSLID